MNREGIELVKSFEGYSPTVYKCSGGVWTLGYGTTRYPDGRRVTKHDNDCTRELAESWLMFELVRCDNAVNRYCNAELNENQHAALSSFIYNLGSGAFRASTLRRRINSGDFDDVQYQIMRWNKAGGRVLRGLIRRRAAEVNLWLS